MPCRIRLCDYLPINEWLSDSLANRLDHGVYRVMKGPPFVCPSKEYAQPPLGDLAEK